MGCCVKWWTRCVGIRFERKGMSEKSFNYFLLFMGFVIGCTIVAQAFMDIYGAKP